MIYEFDPVFISVVRKAIPNIVAADLCSIQPMGGEAGQIFTLRNKIKISKPVPYHIAVECGYCMNLWYEQLYKWIENDNNQDTPTY